MAGPTCTVLIEDITDSVLKALDALLAEESDTIERTRRNRVWEVWIRGRPIHVSANDSPSEVLLSAGCNSPEDYEVLHLLAAKIAHTFGGVASAPVK